MPLPPDPDSKPVVAALVMDRSSPLGNSQGPDGRRRLHVKVDNDASEPIPIGIDVVDFSTPLTQPFFGTAIPVGVETTLLTYTVGVGITLEVLLVQVSGRADALFQLKKNGTTQLYSQIIWTERTVITPFPTKGMRFAAGDILTMTVTNQGELAQNFFGTVHGRTM